MATGCFIDNTLAAGTKDGYNFSVPTATTSTYTSLGAPVAVNTTGTRAFCSDQTGVIYYLAGGACTPASGAPLQ